MEKRKEKRNWLEWTVTIISTVIVVFVIGILIAQLAEKETPPEFHISLGKTVSRNDHFSIPVTVKNSGSLTAQNLNIEFSMGEGEQTEKSMLEFDFLPGKSQVKGWISFSKNPDGKTINRHILGYTAP